MSGYSNFAPHVVASLVAVAGLVLYGIAQPVKKWRRR